MQKPAVKTPSKKSLKLSEAHLETRMKISEVLTSCLMDIVVNMQAKNQTLID